MQARWLALVAVVVLVIAPAAWLVSGRGRPPPAAALHVADGGHHLVDADGKPFFWLADTSYDIACRATRQEAHEYVERRAEQGFTVLRLYLNRDGACTPNVYGEPLREPDGRPGEAYAERLDDVVHEAGARGLHVVIVLWQVDPVLAGWLGHRYRDAQNVLWWVMSPRDTAVVEAVGRGVTGVPTLRADRPDPAWSRLLMGTWVDGVAAADAPWAALRTFTADDELAGLAGRARPRPVVRADGLYEGGVCAGGDGAAGSDDPRGVSRASAVGVRREAWATFVRGAMTAYGCPSAWGFGGTGGSRWRDALQTPGVEALQRFRGFWTARAWWQLRPAPLLRSVRGDPGTRRDAGALLATDRSAAYVYLPGPATVEVDLRGLRVGADEAQARWFDPATGAVLPAEGALPGAVRTLTSPPGWRDAVLEVGRRDALPAATSAGPAAPVIPAPGATSTPSASSTPGATPSGSARGTPSGTERATPTARPTPTAGPPTPTPTRTPSKSPAPPPPPSSTPTVSITRPPVTPPDPDEGGTLQPS